MPLKVLHSLDTANYAGTEAHVLALLCSLDRSLWTPSLLCRPGTVLHERAAAAGIPCHPAGSAMSLSRLLRREPFEVIHAHDGNSKLHAVLAASLSRTKTQVVTTQHFVSPAYAQRRGVKGRLTRAVHRAVNRRVKTQIAVSRAVSEAALERGEVRQAQITVIPNGILIPAAVTAETVQARRAELSLPAAVPLVATAARLAPEKGITYLLHAMAILPLSASPAHLVIVGQGDLREALEQEAADLNLSERVHFLGFRPDVLDWIAAADLFVLPSLAEPFGIALVEAMALGKPAVAVWVGGPCEIVEDGVTGLLVPPADPPALAHAIQQLLDRSGPALAMGQAGEQRAKAFYSAAAMARRTEEVYLACLKMDTGGAGP